MTTADRTTLDYADLPPGSRLIVERDGEELRIADPATGIWHQLRVFLLGWALAASLFLALMFGFLRWRFPQFAGWFGPSTFFRVFLGVLDLQMLVLLSAFAAGATLMGSVSTTVVADPGEVRVISRLALFGREWTWKHAAARAEIARIVVPRFKARVVLVRTGAKPMSLNLWGGRRDALWVARALRHELQLPD